MNEPMPKAGLSECSTLLGAYAMRCLFCLVPAVGLGLAVADEDETHASTLPGRPDGPVRRGVETSHAARWR